MRSAVFSCVCGCLVLLPSAAPAQQPQALKLERIDTPLLPNAYRLHERVISGGLPDGEAAFAKLKELGVRTVISVDGARPDLAGAKKYGLRYVHLPHGYDGIPESSAQSLAKAVRDFPGPVYIHCHHGKHRSPAAATVACISLDLVAPQDALQILKTAGTSENYRGLYQSVQGARKFEDQLLDRLRVEFPETAKIPPIADAMVSIEHVFDRLKSFSAAKWQRLHKQPDLDPAHEALLLREHYHELLRTDAVKAEPAEFQKFLESGEQSALALETGLQKWLQAGAVGDPPKEIDAAYTAVAQSCTACHQKFRDVPLGEKRK